MKTTIKEYLKMVENKEMLYVSLLDKPNNDEYRRKFKEYKEKFKELDFRDVSENGKYKTGDIIEVTAGYNDDIRYTVEILGFDKDDKIYLLWDSFWAPIRDDKVRDIKLVNKTE